MTRDEMLAELHKLNLGINLVMLPSEGAMECNIYSSKGSYCEWIAMDEWPISKLHGLSGKVIEAVAQKAQRNELTLSDLEGTILKDFFERSYPRKIGDVDLLNRVFKELSVPAAYAGDFYALNDGDHCPSPMRFFPDYDSVIEAYEAMYLFTPWEDYADEDLENYLDLESELDSIPYMVFGEDEESEE